VPVKDFTSLCNRTVFNVLLRLHRMHDYSPMFAVSVTRLKSAPACAVYSVPCAWGHVVQPLPNAFGTLFEVLLGQLVLLIVLYKFYTFL